MRSPAIRQRCRYPGDGTYLNYKNASTISDIHEPPPLPSRTRCVEPAGDEVLDDPVDLRLSQRSAESQLVVTAAR